MIVAEEEEVTREKCLFEMKVKCDIEACNFFLPLQVCGRETEH